MNKFCPYLSPSVPGQQGQTQNRPANTCNMSWGYGTRDTGTNYWTHRVPICPHLSWDNRDKLKTGHLTLVICLGDTGHGNKLLTHHVPICPGTTGTNSKHGPANTCNMSWGHGDKLLTHRVPICPGTTGTNSKHGPANTCNMSWGHGTRGETIDTSCLHLSRDNRDKLKTRTS